MIKVLIVEDEPPIARAVKQLICRYSDAFQVVGTEINGRAALERLGRGEVDVVFTDIRMPVMDGLELLENIQRDYPEVVTVLLSGYQEFEYAQKAVRLPASVGRAGRRQASGEGDPPFELPGQPGGGGDLRGQRGAAFRRGRRNARRVRA